MPLIIKGGAKPTIISEKEMKNKLGKMKDDIIKNDPLSSLSPELAEKRREILDAKAHREYLAKIQRNEEDALRKLKEADLKDMEATSELVVETGPDPIVIKHDDVVKVSPVEEVKVKTPDFEAMTKKELDEWAEETLGLALDRRKKKADMIEIVKKNL